MSPVLLPAILLGLALGEQPAAPPAEKPEKCVIGAAKMLADRSIVLRLRAQDPSGALGEGVIIYRPADERYREVLQHIGGLEPGDSKLVPCWPDTKAR